MQLHDIINELDNELSDKKGIFSKKIDIDKCQHLVGELKNLLPRSIAQSEQVLSSRQKILENADTVAQNTIREAEERASHIVDNSELVKQAELEAKKIIEMANMQGDVIIDRTKTHLDNMFKDIEQFLLSTLAMIRNNREELRGAMIMINGK